MPTEHVDFCSVRVRAYSKRVFSGEEVVEIIGPPVIYENGGIEQRVPPTQYDSSSRHLGTYKVTGTIVPPFPASLRGGEAALAAYIRTLEQYGCTVEQET
jgi:hypothetical protein